jgi:hypothetical protein
MPHLLVRWNLKQLAASLVLHLDLLRLSGELWDKALQSEEYLQPYRLSGEDAHAVLMLALGKQCVDCGDVWDCYMVYDSIWRDAGLDPNQCCCKKCLVVRLGRPLERSDFRYCPPNP